MPKIVPFGALQTRIHQGHESGVTARQQAQRVRSCGMEDTRLPTSPAPMEGRGGYNRRSAVQAAGAGPGLPLLEQAAREAVLPEDEASTIVVADYGSSEGHNSLAPMATAIATLRLRCARHRPISVVHTDLPGNDFSQLFALLGTDPDSYLRHDSNSFASAVGSSFYGQILPSASVTLGWSSWAVQWLSRTPMPVPDHVQIAYSRDQVARAAYARQAAQDWEVFLRCRSRELRPGGRLVVVTMASTADGDFGYDAIMAAMYDSLQELVASGLVAAQEAVRMAIPTVGRTRAEFAAPFAAGDVDGLTLQRLDIFEGEDTIWRRFVEDGDASAYGAAWAAFSRASVMPTLALGLEGGAGDPRVAPFVTRLEAGMADRLSRAPEPSTMPLAAVVLAR